MAETTIENRVCNACGSEVRPKSLFCYHCGDSVAPDVVVALKNANAENNGDKLAIEKATDNPIPKPVAVEEPKLKSAAAMRRRAKSFQPKRIEIIWEEHENTANGWFVFAAIFLILFAAGILYVAMFLK